MLLFGRRDRLILGEILGPFLFGVLLFTSLFFAGGEFLRITEFLGAGESLALVGRLTLLTLPGIVVLTFPMAALLAALLGFGRLSNDSEIVALLAGGASFGRLVVPLGAFALGVALVGVWFAQEVVPAANRGREQIIADVRKQVRSANAFTLPLRKDGELTLVHVEGGVDLRSGSLRNVLIATWKGRQCIGAVYADRAVWQFGTREWFLENPTGASWGGEGGVILKGTSLDTAENAILGRDRLVTLGTPEDLATLEERPVKEIATGTLQRRIDIYRRGGAEDKAREAEVEVAQRVAVPFASFVFALVGAPLGVGSQRQGRGVGFGLSILIIFTYWIALQFVSFLGKSGALPPLLALALPNVAGVLIALLLIRRVLR